MLFDFQKELLDLVFAGLILFAFWKWKKKLSQNGLKLEFIELKQIAMIALAVIIADLLFIWLTKPVGLPQLDYSIIKTLILSPVWEELIFRGLILGLMPAMLENKLKMSRNSSWFKATFGFLFFIQAGVFFLAHGSGSAIILVNGLLFGLIYLASGKNLLASITAHTTGNLLIVAISNYDLLGLIG